jgi:phenylpyruvate tautomerase PptA (4-oxalocrotonate tautomerase family)
MPLWNVYCTEGTYSSEQKRAFAEAITDIYAPEDGGLPEMAMPRFYVVVAFHDLPRGFAVRWRRTAQRLRALLHRPHRLCDAGRITRSATEVHQQVHPPLRTRPRIGLGDSHRRHTPKSVDGSGHAPTRQRLRRGKTLDPGKPAVQAGPQQRVEKLKGQDRYVDRFRL